MEKRKLRERIADAIESFMFDLEFYAVGITVICLGLITLTVIALIVFEVVQLR